MKLSHHRFALLGAMLAVCLTMFACAFTGNLDNQKLTASQITQANIDQQATFASLQAEYDQQAADASAAATQAIAQKTAATSPADQAAADAAIQKALASQRAITAQVAKLAADQTAWDQKTKAALAEISQKQVQAQAFVDTLGSVAEAAQKGTSDPVKLITGSLSALLALMGAGAMLDSRAKDKKIATLQNAPSAAPAAGASN